MPVKAEKFNAILKSINEDLLPGVLHWQHPRFHGYFGGGLSYPDILADTLASGKHLMRFNLCVKVLESILTRGLELQHSLSWK